MDTAKFAVEVTAGVIPGTPEDGFTRRWSATDATWQEAPSQAELLAEINGRAQGYAMQYATKDVRAWALEQGREVASSGRLPKKLLQAYEEAHQ